MVKQEVNEIKKLYKVQNCSITRIVGCYVDAEKNKKASFSNNFLNLPEEVIFKYLEIFKKTLSGTVDKNLLTFEFPLKEENEGGCQNGLLKLRNSSLKDDALIEAYMQSVIDTYQYVGNYLILLIDNVYDVPGRARDNLSMEDASDEMYHYLCCAICPVKLSKAGLSYDQRQEEFVNRDRDWIVGNPDVAFTFPAFNNRSSDIHSVLYYEKKAELEHEEVLTRILGCKKELTAIEQKNVFDRIVEELECSLEEVVAIKEDIKEKMERYEETEPGTLLLGKTEIEAVIKEHVSSEKATRFSKAFSEMAGENAQFHASNLCEKNVKIKGGTISIQCPVENAGKITEKIVDGKKCLVIEVSENVIVNGITV